MDVVKIVALADTHGMHKRIRVPDGDILVCAGDITGVGEIWQLREFNKWLGRLPHRRKVVIAGNHDWCFEGQPTESRNTLNCCHYLEDEAVTIEGIKFYGSPWSPRFFNCAFNLDRGAPIRRVWDRVPDDVDVLITHGPPYGCLDKVKGGKRVGCKDLAQAIERVSPKVHIFGHIHEAYRKAAYDGVVYFNASVCTFDCKPTNRPYVMEWDKASKKLQ
jgi:Icc-related predicted phosphoesterase